MNTHNSAMGIIYLFYRFRHWEAEWLNNFSNITKPWTVRSYTRIVTIRNLSFFSYFISLIKRKIVVSTHWNESVPGRVAGKVRMSKGICEHKATCHPSCHLGWRSPPSGLIRKPSWYWGLKHFILKNEHYQSEWTLQELLYFKYFMSAA